MSLSKVHLRKLLQLFDSPSALRTRLLREDIRTQIAKDAGVRGDGGDFFSPFWADAKRHVSDQVDLRAMTVGRIGSNNRRARLYPMLTDGFLRWWDERRRWRNEAFKFIPQQVKAQHLVKEVKCLVKVENLLALEVVGQFNRIVYPYFSEKPPLTAESARIGLWLLGEALTDYKLVDLRILDVLRSSSFGINDYPLSGNERDLFEKKYRVVSAEWQKLRREYGP